MSEKTVENSTEAKDKEHKELSKTIIKIKKERTKGDEHQYSVIYEGDDTKKGVWVNAEQISDKNLIKEFEIKKEKREKAKHSKEKNEKEKDKHKSEKSSHSKKNKIALEKIYGIASNENNEFTFHVKLKEEGFKTMTYKEVRDAFPSELCDFLSKHIVIE